MKAFIVLNIALFISTNCDGFCYLEDDWQPRDDKPKIDFVAQARAALMQVGNYYEHEPTSVDAPLTPELVLNSYWCSMASKSQAEKDDALKKVLDVNFSFDGYFLQRYHYAAAALVKANLNMAGGGCFSSPLSSAALYKDGPLCALLLQQGADPNWQDKHDDSPLFQVEKEPIVQLFLAAGAQVRVPNNRNKTLLHRVMESGYDAVLVKLYIQKGISPLITDNLNTTPLHSLAYQVTANSEDVLKKKEHYLFETLDTLETKKLIEAEHKSLGYNKNVFTILQEYRPHPNCQWLYTNLLARISAASKKQKLS